MISHNIKNVLTDIFNTSTNITYEQLHGGFANEAYRVVNNNTEYFLRINGQQCDYLGLDREMEVDVCKQANKLGIGPEVYNIRNTKNYLLTEFFHGKAISEKQVHEKEMVNKYIKALKKIHENIHVSRDFSAFDLLDGFYAGINDLNIKIPSNINLVLNEVEKIRLVRSNDQAHINTFCHNDYWQNNILYDGNKLIVIDWELCGNGDLFFDLARMPYLNNFRKEEEEYMLQCYFGYYEDEMWQSLQHMKYVGRVSDMLWSFFHSGLSDTSNYTNFDYFAYGEKVLEMLT